MLNSLVAVFAIVGNFIGSGFASGKEIVTFFSRFGKISFLTIILSFFCIYFLIKKILNNSEKILEKLLKSKFSSFVNIFIAFIFTSSMFAGISDLIICDNIFIKFLIIFLILIICFIIYKKGIKSLNKLNLFIVPLLISSLIAFISMKINNNFDFFCSNYIFSPFFYSILYAILNIASNIVLIASLGKNLKKKQKTRVAFFSALVLSAILFFADIVLLQNSFSFDCELPILSLFTGASRYILAGVIFLGCISTLFSLVYTSSVSMRGLCKNEFIVFSISISLPLATSIFGFGYIVDYLYPMASVLALFLLIDLFFVHSFKRANKKIHSGRKQT